MAIARQRPDKQIIGWREWVALPGISISAVKAKVDTGARTSALHAHDIHTVHVDGVERVRFVVSPIQRTSRGAVEAEAEVVEHREVKSSTGHVSVRPVIRTPVDILGEPYDIELTLVNRDVMGFRMLLGREALRRRFLIDPGRSFLSGRPPGAPAPRRTRRQKHDDRTP